MGGSDSTHFFSYKNCTQFNDGYIKRLKQFKYPTRLYLVFTMYYIYISTHKHYLYIVRATGVFSRIVCGRLHIFYKLGLSTLNVFLSDFLLFFCCFTFLLFFICTFSILRRKKHTPPHCNLTKNSVFRDLFCIKNNSVYCIYSLKVLLKNML